MVEQYGRLSLKAELAKLDMVASEAQRYVDGVLVFVLYAGNGDAKASTEVRVARIRNRLALRKIPRERITIYYGGKRRSHRPTCI